MERTLVLIKPDGVQRGQVNGSRGQFKPDDILTAGWRFQRQQPIEVDDAAIQSGDLVGRQPAATVVKAGVDTLDGPP